MDSYPWRCSCGRLNGKRHNFCPGCPWRTSFERAQVTEEGRRRCQVGLVLLESALFQETRPGKQRSERECKAQSQGQRQRTQGERAWRCRTSSHLHQGLHKPRFHQVKHQQQCQTQNGLQLSYPDITQNVKALDYQYSSAVMPMLTLEKFSQMQLVHNIHRVRTKLAISSTTGYSNKSSLCRPHFPTITMAPTMPRSPPQMG